MASIRKEIRIDAPPQKVWAGVRDYASPHRIAPGFVIDSKMQGRDRVLTFFNGLVAKELLVDLDDESRRLAYSAVGGRLTHHNAVCQIFDDGGGGTLFVWTVDLLPDEVAPALDEMMERGGAIMKNTFEASTVRV